MGFSLGNVLKGAVTGFVSSGFNPYGAALGAVGGAVDSYADKSAQKYQQKQNIKLWNMQNEYNSPEAQMQRYVDAGLNPNLIYSQQNTASDITSSPLERKSDTIGGALNQMSQRQQLTSMGLQNEAQEIDNMYNMMYGGKQRQHQNYLTYQQGLMQHEQYERLKMENDFFKKIGSNAKGMDMLFRTLSLMRGM